MVAARYYTGGLTHLVTRVMLSSHTLARVLGEACAKAYVLYYSRENLKNIKTVLSLSLGAYLGRDVAHHVLLVG